VDLHQERHREKQADQGKETRDPRKHCGTDSVEEADIQGKQVSGIPKEQRRDQSKQQPFKSPQQAVPQNQDHEKQVHERPKRVDDQFECHQGIEFVGRFHGGASGPDTGCRGSQDLALQTACGRIVSQRAVLLNCDSADVDTPDAVRPVPEHSGEKQAAQRGLWRQSNVFCESGFAVDALHTREAGLGSSSYRLPLLFHTAIAPEL